MNPTLQRLERILLMVPWLLEHPGASVDEVTDRFGMTREDLAGDLDVLGYCGVPGYGGGDLIEASLVGERVSVRMADFFRRPLRLSLREAMTLLLAGEALADVPGLAESAALRTAVAKLRTVVKDQGRAPVHAAPPSLDLPRVAVDLSAPGDEHLPVLRQALAARRAVELTYRSASKAETTRRTVEPWGVVGAGGAWYLQGWCQSAEAPRDFRLDRIRALTLTDEPVVDRPRVVTPPLVYEPGADDVEVMLELEARDWWVAEHVRASRVENRGDRALVTFSTAELEWVARLLLRLGGRATIVAPAILRERVRARAAAALARYGP